MKDMDLLVAEVMCKLMRLVKGLQDASLIWSSSERRREEAIDLKDEYAAEMQVLY